jgi:hypothetical protein
MKNSILIVLVILSTSVAAYAQTVMPQVINATGGTYRQGSFFLDWSVGELALVNEMKAANTTYIITNGFLQPFTNKSNPPDNGFDNEEIRILPNPTRDILQINFRAKQTGEIELRLYDVPGKILYSKRFTLFTYEHTERIDMTGITNGTYMLLLEQIPADGSASKKGSYKIIKVN